MLAFAIAIPMQGQLSFTFIIVDFRLLVSDSHGLIDRLGLLEHPKHKIGHVGA